MCSSDLPLILIIIALGVLYTIRLKGIQIRHLKRGLHYIFHDEADAVGEVSGFAALCTTLAATIGTGNIVGVATAICTGGPGALFWLVLTAFFGMTIKYAEGFLAVKYRTIDKDGHTLGGPFYYIERGMGEKWKWLAKLIAFFAAVAALCGIGTFTQFNGVTTASKNYFVHNFNSQALCIGFQIF